MKVYCMQYFFWITSELLRLRVSLSKCFSSITLRVRTFVVGTLLGSCIKTKIADHLYTYDRLMQGMQIYRSRRSGWTPHVFAWQGYNIIDFDRYIQYAYSTYWTRWNIELGGTAVPLRMQCALCGEYDQLVRDQNRSSGFLQFWLFPAACVTGRWRSCLDTYVVQAGVATSRFG